MRKLIFLSLAVLLCLPLAVYAASIGGAETQGKGKIGVGFDSSFVFDRDFQSKNTSVLGANYKLNDMKIDQGYGEMLKVSYGLLDWLDVYARLGAEQADSKANAYDSAGVKQYTAKSNSDWGFAWGLGIKGAYPLKNNWLIGADLQYLRSGSGAKVSYTNVNTGVITSTTYKSGAGYEWHIAPYLGYKLGNLIPYLGVRYSDLRAKAKKPADQINFPGNVKSEADDNVGVFVGTDYKIGEHWKLNLEGRFVDETAMSFGATYRF